MNMHLGRPAAMPRRQQHTTPSTLVLYVLEAVHDVGDASETAKTAETGGPCTIAIC